MLTNLLIIFALLTIIVSLGAALFFLLKDPNGSPRTARALTTRIAISIALFFLMLLGYRAGLLHPHGIKNVQTRTAPK
jgi:hypothetical protein